MRCGCRAAAPNAAARHGCSDLEKGELVEAAGSTPTTSASSSSRQAWLKVASQAFTITFLAEWGDRSQVPCSALARARHAARRSLLADAAADCHHCVVCRTASHWR